MKKTWRAKKKKKKTNFGDNTLQSESSEFKCLSVILFDSVFMVGKNYYPQILLVERKHILKNKTSVTLLAMWKFHQILMKYICWGKSPAKKNQIKKILM